MKEISLTHIELDNLPDYLNLKPGDRLKIIIEAEVQRLDSHFEKGWIKETAVKVVKLK